MSRYRFAARLPDSTVRGFVGTGDSEGAACRDCFRRYAAAVQGQGGDPRDTRGVVWDNSRLGGDEWAAVLRDWDEIEAPPVTPAATPPAGLARLGRGVARLLGHGWRRRK